MASYLPPTESLPIFDNMVFDTNNTTALTYATAKNLFVTFPSAQGSSTITDFIAGTINYLSPSSGSFFNIGTNQVSGGTIRIGPTGVSGVSVHAGNIDCTNNTINNATDAALNNLTIGNLQTDGILNIGTGVRTTTGAINIGTGSGANVNHINIGGAGSKASFTNGLSLASGKYISTSHTGTVTAPTTTQVGYIVSGANLTNTIPNSGNVTSLASIALSQGTWNVYACRQYGLSTACVRVIFSFGTESKSNVTPADTDYEYGIVTPYLTAENGYVHLSTTISVLSSGVSLYLNIVPTTKSTLTSSGNTNFFFKAVRIA